MRTLAENFGFLMQGFGVNLLLAALAIPAGLLLAIPIAAARLSPLPWLYALATLYINVLRSSPLLMILFWLYFLAPLALGHQTGAFNSAVFALAIFESAYFAEILRSGIQSVPRGQTYAALATGLTSRQAYLRIVLPQALRSMRPSLLTQSIIAFQDTTLASVLGVLEVDQAAKIINQRELSPGALYGFVAVLFFVVCFMLSRGVARLDRRSAA